MSEQPPKALAAQPPTKQVTGSPLRIEFAKAGTVPPVFVAGSFTSWNPVELTSTSDKPEEAHFARDFPNISEGEHQYKFRLGPGDWWTTDERVRTVTDEHGNKNNVINVKNELTSPSSGEAPKQADKVPDQATKASSPASDASSTAAANPASVAGAMIGQSTPPKQTASTAAEVADTAAKLDQSPADKDKEPIALKPGPSTNKPADQLAGKIAEPPVTTATEAPTAKATDVPAVKPKEAPATKAVEALTPKDAQPLKSKTADQIAESPTKLDQVLAKQMSDQTTAPSVTKKTEPRSSEDGIASPGVPPAPAVTPVAVSPPLAPIRPDHPETSPLPPTPMTPLKSFDSAVGPSDVKPSKQELAVAVALPFTPKQPSALSNDIKAKEKDSPAPAQVALPPSPATELKEPEVVSEPSQSGEFPQDDFKLVKRQTTFRERSVAVANTVIAIPEMIAALFASIIQAFMDYLNKMFNPQRGARGDKDGKSE